MAVLKYYNTSTSTWQAVDVGAQGPQGTQGVQGAQGAITAGQLLGTTQYAPASLVTYSLSTTLAKLDTTNLTLSFTVPASGNVDIDVMATMQWSATSGGEVNVLGLFQHGTSTQLGYTTNANGYAYTSPTSFISGVYVRFHLTGLTPGALQVDLAAGNGAGTGELYACGYTGNPNGSKTGPVLMQAFAA
jgi:hypothetical protein